MILTTAGVLLAPALAVAGALPPAVPNPAAAHDHEPAEAGAPGTPQAPPMRPPAPAPAAGAPRAVAPSAASAATPPSPGAAAAQPSGKPGKQADPRASRVAAKVLLFLQLLGEQDVQITAVREGPMLYEVRWHAKPATPAAKRRAKKVNGKLVVEGKIWVTLDGRYMTRRAVVLERALAGYRKDRAFMDCLKNRGARVLLQPGTKGTAKQLQALGAFGQELIIWCPKKLGKLCDLHGSGYPRWLWPKGSRPGVMAPAMIGTALGCKR